MDIYVLKEYDGECEGILAICKTPELAEKAKQWFLEHDTHLININSLEIVKETFIDCEEDIGKEYVKVYEIETNQDCSIKSKEIFWRLDKYDNDCGFIHTTNIDNYHYLGDNYHYLGTGICQSRISYEDAWNKLVIKWDECKFSNLTRITKYPGD